MLAGTGDREAAPTASLSVKLRSRPPYPMDTATASERHGYTQHGAQLRIEQGGGVVVFAVLILYHRHQSSHI